MSNYMLLKRLQSLAWRGGMMAIAAFLSYLSAHLGVLEVSAPVTAVIGLVLGEVSKYLNTVQQS